MKTAAIKKVNVPLFGTQIDYATPAQGWESLLLKILLTPKTERSLFFIFFSTRLPSATISYFSEDVIFIRA